MPTKKITDESFESEVKNNKNLVIDFWAEWCAPCKQISPVLEEISDELREEVVIAKHNIDENPNQPSKYGVRGIPTMLLFKNGEMVSSKIGASPKASLQSWIEENK